MKSGSQHFLLSVVLGVFSILGMGISVVSVSEHAQARALFNTFRPPHAKMLEKLKQPEPSQDNPGVCPALVRSSGALFQKSGFATPGLDRERVQDAAPALVREFSRATREFAVSAADLSSAPAKSERAKVRDRLLRQVGWDAQMNPEQIKKWMDRDPRAKSALSMLICEMSGEQHLDLCEVDLKAVETAAYREKFRAQAEQRLLYVMAEGLTIEEMLSARIIPSDQTRVRLFVAWAQSLGFDVTPAVACPVSKGAAENSLVRPAPGPAFLLLFKAQNNYWMYSPQLQSASADGGAAGRQIASVPKSGDPVPGEQAPFFVSKVMDKGAPLVSKYVSTTNLCFTSQVQLQAICQQTTEGR